MADTIIINGKPVAYTTETPSIDVPSIVSTFVPFQDWCASVDPTIRIEHIHFQHVDVSSSGSRILFVKMKCTAYIGDEKQPVPGIILLRGSAVSCLIEIICEDKTYALLVEQPRLPSGKSRFREVVAGMIDGQRNFTGGMVREIKEETGLDIKPENMINLTELASGPRSPGMYTTVGLCDETIHLFLYRVAMDKADLDSLQGRLTGLREDGEYITLIVIPMEELWRENDAKTLASAYLREKLLAAGRLPPPIPFKLATATPQ